jgi:hypothetical protein
MEDRWSFELETEKLLQKDTKGTEKDKNLEIRI